MVLLVVEAVNWKGIEMKPFGFNVEETVEFLRHAALGKPFLPYLVPLFFLAWGFDKWVFSFSNWIPLAIAVWATLQVIILLLIIPHNVCYQIKISLLCLANSQLCNLNPASTWGSANYS